MLKPFKSFLTYIQKNASTSSLFSLSPNNMNDSEEQIVDQSDVITSDVDYDDPLTDPLALDDVEPNLCGNIPRSKTNHNTGNDDESNGSIIIVDVQALTARNFTPEVSSTPLSKINGSLTKGVVADQEDIKIEEPIVDSNSNENKIKKTSAEDLEDPVEEEVRSDGSDSGLGSEPSRNVSVIEKEIVYMPPLKSNLKRKLMNDTGEAIAEKRPKKSITFDNVTVYYFPRIQGFGCVPSQGGCTLGMESNHMHIRTFSLSEHAAEIRRVHRQQLQELNAAVGLGPLIISTTPTIAAAPTRSSSSEDTDSEEEPSENSGSEGDSESYGFLQPVTTRQRRILLKSSGVRSIDITEKDECRLIRSSREVCGCSCRSYCDPDTCECSQSGIKCQVDRSNFPCGCSRDGCANVVGRMEFNPGRVRTHYIHTIMRLDLEQKQKPEDSIGASNNNSFNNGWPGTTALQSLPQPQPIQIPQLNLSYSTSHLDQFNQNSISIFNEDYQSNYPNYLGDHNAYTHYQYDTDSIAGRVGVIGNGGDGGGGGGGVAVVRNTDDIDGDAAADYHSVLQIPSTVLHTHSHNMLTNLSHIETVETTKENDVISLNTPELNSDRIDVFHDLLANNRNSNYSAELSNSHELLSPSSSLLPSPSSSLSSSPSLTTSSTALDTLATSAISTNNNIIF